jgi:hypothetical protein
MAEASKTGQQMALYLLAGLGLRFVQKTGSLTEPSGCFGLESAYDNA